jgi:hypothetical protein
LFAGHFAVRPARANVALYRKTGTRRDGFQRQGQALSHPIP